MAQWYGPDLASAPLLDLSPPTSSLAAACAAPASPAELAGLGNSRATTSTGCACARGISLTNPAVGSAPTVAAWCRLHQVDHIVPFTSLEDPHRLDPENLRSLCAPCHAQRHADERKGGVSH